MANIPQDLRYTRDHEWVRTEGATARVGITDYAQRQLGDIVFVELPGAGDRFEASEPFGSVESVKSVTEIYAPVAGSVRTVNETLSESPEDVNSDPYGDGWLIEIEMADPKRLDDLLDAKAYHDFCAQEEAD
ncbi:glycine cleavage system protein GcvH [Streptomyces sp. B6B3]|uniref:glycine cleavage system protein GcvH n=1 Tax=Streptomyces sp. B6B3 TaxID=3153570 RepID=UPI00325C3550